MIYNCHQRFSAWRCGGNLAQKLNIITAIEPCINVSYKHFNRHIAKPMLAVRSVLIFSFGYLVKVFQ